MKHDLAQYASDEFDLDVRIVEFGPVAAALLEDTDDGCDTVRVIQRAHEEVSRRRFPACRA